MTHVRLPHSKLPCCKSLQIGPCLRKRLIRWCSQMRLDPPPASRGCAWLSRARRDVRLRHFRTEAHFWGAGGHGCHNLWRMNSLGRNAQKITLFEVHQGVSWVLSRHISPSYLVDNHRMPRPHVEGFHCFNGALQGAK